MNDKNADTIDTLCAPIIKVCQAGTPPMAFFLVPQAHKERLDGIAYNVVNVEGYVHMATLSKDLQDMIRAELGIKPTPVVL